MPAPLRSRVLGLVPALTATITPAAELEARIDLSDQEMTAVPGGVTLYRWPVSTARPDKVTPTGTIVPPSFQLAGKGAGSGAARIASDPGARSSMLRTMD